MLEQLESQARLTLNQWKIMIAAILGDMLDFFDYFLIGYVLAFIVHDWLLGFETKGRSIEEIDRALGRDAALQPAGVRGSASPI
jgi:hypothetical protein